MSATQARPAIIGIVDESFLKNYQDGLKWAKFGSESELTDVTILAFVHDNVLGEAFNPPLTDDMVQRHTAFLVGWIVGALEGASHA